MGEVAGDSRVQTEVLEGLSAAVNYRNWICDLASPHLGPRPVEIGSGNGDYADTLADRGHRIVASEAEPSRRASIERRFAADDRVDVRDIHLPLADDDLRAEFTGAVAINVLEHIADDLGALRSMAELVEPGGSVVLFVPAFPMAMSRFDREVGHHRRYRRRGLVDVMSRAGLVDVRAHYVNLPGLFAWILLMRLGRQRPGEGFALRVFEALVPLLRRIEDRWRPPVGQSLFAVGTVPGGHH